MENWMNFTGFSERRSLFRKSNFECVIGVDDIASLLVLKEQDKILRT